jgi:hypothetical protein
MSRTLRTVFALSLIAAAVTACGGSQNAASAVANVRSPSVNAERTCGVVSAAADGGFELQLHGQSAEILKLAPQDGATFYTLALAARELKVACFENKPHNGELQVVSVALMEIMTTSQKCGSIAKAKSEQDVNGDRGTFVLGTMGGRSWISIGAEDGATFNTLEQLAETGGTACIVANYESDPGFPVSVVSVAFITPAKK